ncbi:hypothetical protein Tco_0337625 [Tanacetum coccineum]
MSQQRNNNNNLFPLPPQLQQGSSESLLIKRMGELEQHIADRVEENQALESRLEKQGSRIRKLETMDWTNMIREQTTKFIESTMGGKGSPLRLDIRNSLQRHVVRELRQGTAEHCEIAYEALQAQSMRDEDRTFDDDKGSRSKLRRNETRLHHKPPPGGRLLTTPSSSTTEDQSTAQQAPSSSKTAASAEYSAWTTTGSQTKPSITQIPDDLYMDEDTTADVQAKLVETPASSPEEQPFHFPDPALLFHHTNSPSQTNNWASALKSTYAPPQENSLLAQTGDMGTFMDWFCKQRGITELTPKDLEGPAFEIRQNQVDDSNHQVDNTSASLFHWEVEPAIPALSISKMKAAYYPDVGLEQLVPDQFWIEEECKYDIAAIDKYGVQMIMRFNEIHKFSDGTLQQIDEALDYRVKEFQINRTNPGMNTRFWSKKDVDRSRGLSISLSRNG